MKKVITIYKEIGETPLEAIEKFRIERGIALEIPITYAGRLDPMAEGLLIVLVGEECKEKTKYTNLDKEYEVEVLIGVETDSYDVLGLIEKVDVNTIEESNLAKYVGKLTQEYPRYSSKIIAMKEIPDEIPTKEVEIFSIEKIEERALTGSEIVAQIIEKIAKVGGDFRQKETITKWHDFERDFGIKKFTIIKMKVSCSSGTYMRSLAHRMAGLAFSIKRIRVGKYIL